MYTKEGLFDESFIYTNLNSSEPYISYGQSFGMCIGYCQYQVIHSPGAVRIIETAWNNQTLNPPIKTIRQVNESQFNQLLKLLDFEEFYNLPERIGCPDCADGGASWIETSYLGKVYRVTYEYGNPPNQLKNLEIMLKEN